MVELDFRKAVYEMFLKFYEKSATKDVKSIFLVQVIDKATYSKIRIGSEKAIIIIVSTFTAYFISIFIALFRVFIEGVLADENNKNRIELIKQYALFKKKSKVQ